MLFPMKKMEKDTVIFPLSPKLMKSEKKKLVRPLRDHFCSHDSVGFTAIN